MIGVIADDLTGAAELGGVGVRNDLTAEIVIQGETQGEANLVCLDTDSRSCTPTESARRAAAAARTLRRAGATWIYKKVDSVLRGHVLAEIRAIQKTLGFTSVLLVPANPGLGRVIRKGHYYVKGKLIHQTDFAHDPEYPRTSSNVLEMLGASKGHPVAVRNLKGYVATEGIVLGEVSSSADLQEWASRRNANTLLCGGAEFFATLLSAMAPMAKRAGHAPNQSARVETSPSTDRRELFICGSTSDFTTRFVNECRTEGIPVFSLLELGNFPFKPALLKTIAATASLALRSHPRVVLTIGRPLIEERTVSRRLARHLTEVARLVIARAKPEHVYAEGGATAAELVRHSGWKRMIVEEEIAQGVTTLRLANRKSPRLTIKPGSYEGWSKLS